MRSIDSGRARPGVSRGGDPAPGFRADIEGLRAVAVGTVMWFHAGIPGLTGGFAGVDIFFVISGYLITGQLVGEVERSGRISLPRFYARRAKRLLPAAATVLLATAALTWLALPKFWWREWGADIAAAAGYVVNWRLAAREVGYLAEDSAAGPVQHFWSLAVEEQFYLVWPLLLAALALLIRRRSWPVRPTMAAGLAAIALPSLIWSIHLTAADPARAYFVTTTRLWELAAGALVAVGTTVWARLNPALAVAAGWAGLAAIAAGLLTQSTTTAWPGSAALVPVLGAAAVIVGGHAAGQRGPVIVLGRAPMVRVGGLSYSLYLWHWPFVVAAQTLWQPAGRWLLAAAVLASGIPAWLTYRFIEGPARFHPAMNARAAVALLTGLACSVTSAAGSGPARGRRSQRLPSAR